MALSETELAELKEALRRCSAETIDAAIRFREHQDVTAVRTIVYGLIDRYQPPTATLRLKDANENTRLVEDLGFDSLTLLELVMSIEEVLKLNIENEQLREIRTLGHLNQYLKDKIAGAQTAPPVKVYSREHIAVVLPQQPPFMFLDEAEMNGDKVTARYLIKGDEFFLAGHFKDEPIFPASIQFEAIGQAACLWVLEKIPTLLGHPIPTNQIFFASLDGARVFRKARPGQQLVIEVKLTKFRDPVAMFQGHITVDGQRTAQIEQLMLAFGDQIAPEQPASPQPDAPPPAATPAPTA